MTLFDIPVESKMHFKNACKKWMLIAFLHAFLFAILKNANFLTFSEKENAHPNSTTHPKLAF